MNIKLPSKMEISRRKMVSGFTYINHSIRVSLGLSLEEYVLMDFIHNHNQKEKEPITFGHYYRNTGFINHEIQQLLQIMKERELLVWNNHQQRVDVCEAWKRAFSKDEGFDKLWKKHSSGNKQTAKTRYYQCLKKISPENLEQKLTEYLQACKVADRLTKGLDVWLNPKKEHWNDPLPKPFEKSKFGNQPVTKTAGIFFKK